MSSPKQRFTRWSRDVLARIADFRTHRVIAEWGSQCALEARSNEDDRLVVLDVLDPQSAAHARLEQSFREGSQVALGLKHPNVLEVIESGQCPHSGLLYVASEHPGESTLADLVGEDGRLQEEDALALVQQVAEGLAAASERRLHHGRLTPAAVGLDIASTPRIAGFGLPRPRRSEVADAQCLAPEQVTGVGEPDARVDVYALGCVLFRLLTGRFPFEGDTYDAIATQHASGAVGDPRELEPEVTEATARVVGWMTAHDRLQRYPTVHAVSLDLLRVMGGEEPRGPEGGRLQHPQELVELLRKIEMRRPEDPTPRGLWGTGPAYAFKVVLATQDNVLDFKHFARARVVLGRSPKVEMPIDNPIVSRQHAQLARIGAHFLIEPLSKTNPTEVNGVRVQGPTWIRTGQSVLLSGKFNVRVFWAPHQVAEAVPEVTPHDSKAWVVPPTQRMKVVPPEALTRKAKQPKKPPPPPEERLPGSEGYLVYRRGGGEVRTLLNHPFQIGRSAVCDLRLKDADAPHKAAMVVPARDGFRLYSLVPDAAYVRLNGEPVSDLALLEVGDEVTLGSTTLRFLS